jgi:ubiquinone/menaquinone biosynthesis C-methylase UbiE
VGKIQPSRYYDNLFRLSRAYRADPEYAPWYPAWQWVCRKIGDGIGEAILDIGCGPGHCAQMLSKQKWEVWGCDFSKVALEAARARCPTGTFIEGHLPEVLEEAPEAQVAVCCEVLEHIEDDLVVLDVLKERGARVYITVPRFDDPSHVRHFPTLESVQTRYGGDHIEPIGAHRWGVIL